MTMPSTWQDRRVDILDGLLALFSVDFSGNRGYESIDRKLIEKRTVRSGLQATGGRVADIGTDWSSGLCEITPRHLYFKPRIGVVGDRDIDVTAIRAAPQSTPPGVPIFGGTPVTFVMTTAGGELYWMIMQSQASQALRLLELTPAPREA